MSGGAKKLNNLIRKGFSERKKLKMSDVEIGKLFDYWNRAVQSGDPKKVTELYDEKAILLPTVSNEVRHNHAEIEEYFRHFLSKAPKGKVNESNVRVFGDIAINSGLYTFTFKDESVVRARFSFVYERRSERWIIVEHHSSAMPE